MLEIRVYQPNGSVRVVEATGEVDVTTIAPFAQAMQQAAASGLALLVDLTPVNYIDTAGLQELVSAHKAVSAYGHQLRVVVKPESQPEYVINTVMLETIISVFNSLGAALGQPDTQDAG